MEYRFNLPELTDMLNDIDMDRYYKKRVLSHEDVAFGTMVYGHPVLNMAVLGEYIDKRCDKDCSMREYLEKNSKYPLDKWEFYLGL